jgi:hypothetical protein
MIVSVVELEMPLPLALVWRRGNTSPWFAHFIGEVLRRQTPEQQKRSKVFGFCRNGNFAGLPAD